MRLVESGCRTNGRFRPVPDIRERKKTRHEAGFNFHPLRFGLCGPALGKVAYFGGAANGLGISMSVVNGHSLISSGMWPLGYHFLGGISLASTVSLITS